MSDYDDELPEPADLDDVVAAIEGLEIPDTTGVQAEVTEVKAAVEGLTDQVLALRRPLRWLVFFAAVSLLSQVASCLSRL